VQKARLHSSRQELQQAAAPAAEAAAAVAAAAAAAEAIPVKAAKVLLLPWLPIAFLHSIGCQLI
jgi:hypothetical protein